MIFKSTGCKSLALIALLTVLSTPSQAQSAKASIAVPPADKMAQASVSDFVDQVKEKEAALKCQGYLQDKKSGQAPTVDQIRSYRACKADRMLHSMSVWRWNS